MPTTWRPFAGLSLAAMLLAACAGASPSPTPDPTPPGDARFLLRITTVQALPPSETFSWLPQLVVTLDGRVLMAGAVPAVFPGLLVQPIFARQLSPAGWRRIVEAARAAGLLSGAIDFGGLMPPGAAATRLEIVADGRTYTLTGDAGRTIQCIQAPCVAPPGTPEAFAGFLSALSDPASIAGAGELGPEVKYVPEGYAVIVGAVPDDQGLPQAVTMAWPLAAGFATFGQPLGDGSQSRCGVVTGADAIALHGPFGAANPLTPWRDPVDGSMRGLVVRPILPGDGDPCQGIA